jgi:heat shock protein HslJ
MESEHMGKGQVGKFGVCRWLIIVSTFSALSAVACGGNSPAKRTIEHGPPTIEDLAAATFGGIFDEPVTLVGGRWEGEPWSEGAASRPSAGLVDHFLLVGDLDGDGFDDAAVLLWESSGGSGNRIYLAAVGRRDGSIENLATTLIGDRVQVRSGRIEDNHVTLDLIRAGPDDAACCPTEKATVTWALTDDGLHSTGDEITGTLSLSDLGGQVWLLSELSPQQSLPEDLVVSLVFAGDRVSGTSGCNDYFAGVEELTPGELRFSGMGATRKACPGPVMDLEERYLTTLAGASRYSFLAGHLVISCASDEGLVTLIYRPRS